jgi:NTP pyrophosphatase (non-canonical NTP hydrolase)
MARKYEDMDRETIQMMISRLSAEVIELLNELKKDYPTSVKMAIAERRWKLMENIAELNNELLEREQEKEYVAKR